MKRIGWLLVFVVVSKIGYDQIMRSIAERNLKKADEKMETIAREMDAKTPITGPLVKVTKVEYSQRVLRFSAVVTGDALSAQIKSDFTKSARTEYCAGKFIQAKVGIDYEVLGPPRNINDLNRESWLLSLRPENC
jgi:hypothetical protein